MGRIPFHLSRSISPHVRQTMELVSPAEYADYLGTRQRGRGLPVFKGSPFQRGHGFGGILSSLFRLAMPLGRAAIKTGIRALPKITTAGGRTLIKNAIKKNAPKLLKEAVSAGIQAGLSSTTDRLSRKSKPSRKRKRPVNKKAEGAKRPRKESIKGKRSAPSTLTRKKATKRRTSPPKFNDIFD